MKSGAAFILCVFVLGLSPGCADDLWLKNGERIAGVICQTDGKAVTLESSQGAGKAQVPYPVALIRKIHFSTGAETAKDREGLKVLWAQRSPFLALPESNSGEIGLAYARRLLGDESSKSDQYQQAFDIAAMVEKGDWMLSRRTEAAGLRLSAMARMGRADQAMEEASKMENLTGVDEDTLAELRVRARLIQAESAWAKLRQLEKDWPKWNLMPAKRIEREVLLNAALDGFLFPAAFHAELKKLCAEGLCRAAEISCLMGDGDRNFAALCVREVVEYFQDPEFKSRAEALARENKLTVKDK